MQKPQLQTITRLFDYLFASLNEIGHIDWLDTFRNLIFMYKGNIAYVTGNQYNVGSSRRPALVLQKMSMSRARQRPLRTPCEIFLFKVFKLLIT